MEPHHFSSQTHDLESCPLREENRQLKKKLEDANGYAQTLEWARDKAKQENKELSYHIEFVLKKRINELEFTAKSFDAEILRSHARIKELEKNLEDVQNTMATENTDLGMENFKLKERIKELETRAKRIKEGM